MNTIQDGINLRGDKYMGKARLQLEGQHFDKLTVISFSTTKNGRTMWNASCVCGKKVKVSGSYLVNGDVTSCGCNHRKDITGQKFGKLLVVSFAYTKNGSAYWNVKCDCGNTNVTKGSSLRSNRILSCGCSQIKDLTNMVFGKLTVISLHKRSRGRAVWYCKCACGGTKLVASNNLQRGSVTTCGCFVRYIDLVGKTFGRLFVLELNEVDQDGVKWKCQCKCGIVKTVRAGSLVSGKTRSCGCSKKRPKLGPKQSGFNLLFNQYKHRSNKYKILFTLPKETFKILTSSNCFYCGSLPYGLSCSSYISDESKKIVAYPFNGIDRLDSSLGYTIENSVPCCKTCNYAKSIMSVEEFKAWIKKVHDHLCL